MFHLHSNQSLRLINTFGVDEMAVNFCSLDEEAQLTEDALNKLPGPLHVLGGGSNILLTGPVGGTVLRNQLKGIKVISESAESVLVEAAAGEIWHDLVLYAIGNNWGGIENLALIPGTVGAAPIQNIGAYGVEVKETIDRVWYYDLKDHQIKSINAGECSFGYRDSVFKQELKGGYIILSVIFKLSKMPQLRLDYGAIRAELDKHGIKMPTISDVAQSVISIRRSKLPDPLVTGNAGSFFKNPVISEDHFEELKTEHEDIPSFPVAGSKVKVPAGWLIEQDGWKGYRDGDKGVHPHQALVLVNYGNAGGKEILELSERIINSVHKRFKIKLEREVQIW